MVKNSASTAYGAKGLSSSKWLLLVCAASAAVVDIIIIALLAAGGEAGGYLACPILLLIFDACYLAVSLFFTNFRFKYSIWVWAGYIALYTVGFVIGLAIILGGDGTVLTNGALILWSCVHAFNILCAVVCALFASRVFKKMWFALAVAAVFVAGAAVYAGFMFSDGFFGQGKGNRTLVYALNASGEYTVTDVLAGRSDTVTVPETFNGKPVTAVSYKVLANGSISNYSLPENIEFTDKSALNRGTINGKKITVDKKSVNEIRNKFLAVAKESGNENAIALANATLPANLAVNEGYVAFNYDKEGFEAADGNTIPVYVGDLKNFDFSSYTAEYDYVVHRQDGSAENLYWAYNNGGYILSDTGVADNVTSSTVAVLKFEKVYRIKVDGGNDTKYNVREIQPELCYDNVGGSSDYKYLTKPMAGDFLNGLTPRNGFTYRWLYFKPLLELGGKYFTDLTEILEDDITISPRWALNKPTVTVSTSASNNTITYGDDVTLSSDVTHDIDGIKTTYRWTFEDETLSRWTSQNVSLTHPSPSDYSGTYKLVVTVGGDDITSLGAVEQTSVNLKINRKLVELNWNLPESMVYDGTEKSVSVTVGTGQEVEGDPIRFSIFGTTRFTAAKDYNCFISLDTEDEKNYNVTNSELFFSVTPRPVEVVWTDYDNLTYNGSVQAPKATANGIAADGALPVNVSGGQKNAGENYTAHASVSNDNYTLTNHDRTFGIAKKALTATLGDTSVVYGAGLDTVNISYQGFAGSDGSGVMSRPIFYTVPAIGDEDYNAGTFAGGVRCTGLNADNYSVTVVNGDLTVTPRTVTISWGMPSLVYDGSAKNITATVINRLAGDDVALTVSGGNGVTVDTYTATVTGITGADAGNYKLPDNVTTQYTITKRTATVVWNLPQNPVYTEEGYNVTYTIDNLVESDRQYIEFVNFKCDAVGTYGLSVKYLNADYIRENYNLLNEWTELEISKAQGAVEFFVNRIPYDDYDTAVIVGDTLSWKGNSHIWGYTVSLNGQTVYSSSDENVGAVFVYTDEGSYEFTAAGYYVFEIEVGGYDDNTTRNTVTFVISNVVNVGGENHVV